MGNIKAYSVNQFEQEIKKPENVCESELCEKVQLQVVV